MNKSFFLALIGILPAHADVTWVQETMPGLGIPSGRGYVTTPAGGGYTRVQPMQGGIIDTSRPGYLIGPTIGQDDPLRDPKYGSRYGYGPSESDP